MRLTGNRHSPCRKIRVDELVMAPLLLDHRPPLVLQSINDVGGFHLSEHGLVSHRPVWQKESFWKWKSKWKRRPAALLHRSGSA